MKVKCAWCGKDMGEKEGMSDQDVSHGICQECYDKVMKEENPPPKVWTGKVSEELV